MLSQNVYATILDALNDGVLCFNQEQTLIFLNSRASKMLGYSSRQAVGMSLWKFIPDNEKNTQFSSLKSFIGLMQDEQYSRERFEVLLMREDGSLFPAEIAISKVVQGDTWIGTVVLHDLSEVKRHEYALTKALLELEDSNRQLREVSRVQNEFIGIAAHDLRTPLHRLGLSIELFEHPDSLDADKRERFFMMMKRAVKGMQQLIDDLLSVNKISAGKLRLRIQEVPLRAFMKEFIDFNTEFARIRGITLQLVNETTLEKARFDPERMQQVLNNLVSNALKFSPEHTTVTVGVSSNENELIFSVQDQGMGISEDDQKKLFEPFVKLTNIPLRGESSTGLGLTICKQMVELHGGHIEVESEVGKGTSLRVFIPQAEQETV